jgi:hypothetical protein
VREAPGSCAVRLVAFPAGDPEHLSPSARKPVSQISGQMRPVLALTASSASTLAAFTSSFSPACLLKSSSGLLRTCAPAAIDSAAVAADAAQLGLQCAGKIDGRLVGLLRRRYGGQLLKAQFTSVQLTLNCRRKAKGRPRPDGLSSNLHPPTTTKASIVNDARTSIVSKEASFMMTSASTPRGTVVDSII